ncbi:MAG: dipicolinate synthase subunit DpsA [Vulcanibacillus sp.]
MLTGIRVGFIGGDARQLEVIKKISSMDAIVTLIGFENIENNFKDIYFGELDNVVIQNVDVLILPIIGTDDEGYIESIFSEKKIMLSKDCLSKFPNNSILFTGIARPYLKNMCDELNINLVELLNRDDVAIYNSIPTVEGALMFTIQNTDFTIHGSKAIVLGFGRTGITLARVLDALGASVSVGVRKIEYMARIYEMGLESFHIDDLDKNVSEVDLLFNTIPQMIITEKIIANMPLHAFIFDLASKPGGTDFHYAEKRGIKAMLAPGLPGIIAPKTAGNIIGDVIIKSIIEHFGVSEVVQ